MMHEQHVSLLMTFKFSTRRHTTLQADPRRGQKISPANNFYCQPVTKTNKFSKSVHGTGCCLCWYGASGFAGLAFFGFYFWIVSGSFCSSGSPICKPVLWRTPSVCQYLLSQCFQPGAVQYANWYSGLQTEPVVPPKKTLRQYSGTDKPAMALYAGQGQGRLSLT